MIKLRLFITFSILFIIKTLILNVYADNYEIIFEKNNLENTLIWEYQVADLNWVILNKNQYIEFIENIKTEDEQEYIDKFTCNSQDINNMNYLCWNKNIWDFSLIKFLKNYDSDNDWINDFYDYEVNTNPWLINFVCNSQDINNSNYDCWSRDLWVFKIKKFESLRWSNWWNNWWNNWWSNNFNQIWQNQIWNLEADHSNINPRDDNNIRWSNTDNINVISDSNSQNNLNNSALSKVWENNNFFTNSAKWTEWIRWLLLRIARDLRLIIFSIVWLIWLIVVIKLIFWNNTEEEAKKLKTFLIWWSLWIIVMQIAFSTYTMLFDKNIWQWLWATLSQNLVWNFISLLNLLAWAIFVAIMIYSFFQIITANWDEEKAKKWKMIVLQAIMWMIVIKASDVLVKNTFNAWCSTSWSTLFWTTAICENITDNVNIIYTIINWINSFIWIATVIIIIYAWFLITTSWWDEEKTKKAKKMMLYVGIWLALLLANYIIVTFFMAEWSGLSNINL